MYFTKKELTYSQSYLYSQTLEYRQKNFILSMLLTHNCKEPIILKTKCLE